MSEKLLLDYDPYTGRSEYFDYKHHNKGAEMEITTDYDKRYEQAVMQNNAALRNMGRSHYAKDSEMWHGATIPASVQLEWRVKYGITDITDPEFMPLMIRLLNSLDYCHLKTANITL